jgi:hypothetical protein
MPEVDFTLNERYSMILQSIESSAKEVNERQFAGVAESARDVQLAATIQPAYRTRE